MRHDSRPPSVVVGGPDPRHRPGADRRRARNALDSAAVGLLDRLGAGILLVVLSPLIIALSIAIMLDSPGPPFFWCRRLGYRNREFGMVKFRKMHVGAAGLPLTSPDDDRFTRLGRFLSRSKLDEVPQLWNVLRGEMSLVGPRPEDRRFVELQAEAYESILNVKPGITCLSQIAFVRESEILDPTDRERQYLERVLPQKVLLDQLYAERRSFRLNVRILVWTLAAVVFHRQVAVHRDTGRLTLRRRPAFEPAAQQLEAA
ncbi:MAG TPA: sugar transferase [Gaiellaceae bacterium]|nr:sugar transferase [Gaiellaceae bacterium]